MRRATVAPRLLRDLVNDSSTQIEETILIALINMFRAQFSWVFCGRIHAIAAFFASGMWMTASIGCATSNSVSSSERWAVAIHGGAGTIEKNSPPEMIALYERSLQIALQVGRDVLAKNGSALDACEGVVRTLEEDQVSTRELAQHLPLTAPTNLMRASWMEARLRVAQLLE